MREDGAPALKLLVVDDDPASLELITSVFTSLAADVRPVAESPRAVDLVNKERFDGIFLDVEMPAVNGFEIAHIVRQSSWNKSTPIVMITDPAQPNSMPKSFSMGATFMLQKPLDKQKLTTLLRTVQGTLLENRRRYTRVPIQTDIECTVGTKLRQGVTWNLSQGGMQVEVSGLHPSDAIELSFKLPATVNVVEASGEVMWEKNERQGIHFTELPGQSQKLIRDFITRIEPSSK